MFSQSVLISRLTILPVLLSLSVCSLPAQTEEISVEPQGIYAEIDVAASNTAVITLRDGDPSAQMSMVEQISADPLAYNPTAIMALSQYLFSQATTDIQKDEAVWWYLLGEVRAFVDAKLCADHSARQKVTAMRQAAGRDFLLHIVNNAADYVPTMEKALSYVRENKASYDHRWINLHGMGAMIAALATQEKNPPDTEQKPLSVPQEQWDEVSAEVLQTYRESFMKMVDQN